MSEEKTNESVTEEDNKNEENVVSNASKVNVDASSEAIEQDNEQAKEAELSKTLKELAETNDKLKRVAAEFDNYKKRTQKEREVLYGNLVSDIITSFLPIIDNMEKAVSTCEDENYKKGIELILKQFMDILISFNVQEIETIRKNI